MTTAKYLGIWMDHANAHLMEYSSDSIASKTVASKFTHENKIQSLSKSENLMHNKEQHQQAEYYKLLGEAIRNYEEVILFGPTQAKTELHNILKADHLFKNVQIEIIQTDKMTEEEQHLFVKTHFSKRKIQF